METLDTRQNVRAAVELLQEILDESRKQTAILEKIAADTERTKQNTVRPFGSVF